MRVQQNCYMQTRVSTFQYSPSYKGATIIEEDMILWLFQYSSTCVDATFKEIKTDASYTSILILIQGCNSDRYS